jgi:hypothetical protein
MTEDDGLGGLLRANRLRECIRACVDVLRAMSTPKFDSIRSQQIRSKLEDLAVLYRPLGIDLHSWLWEYYEQQARHSASEPHPRAVLESVTQQAGSLSQQDEDRERLMGTMVSFKYFVE